MAKDGSKKEVSFYVRVYSEKEFLYCFSLRHDYEDYACYLRLSPTGEYTIYDDSGSEYESGLYTVDLLNKTLTLNKTQDGGNTTKVWNYAIVSRSKLILSDKTTQVIYTRNYKQEGATCTSNGFLYMQNGPDEIFIMDYKGMDITVTIPSMIKKRKVTSFGGISGNTEIEKL